MTVAMLLENTLISAQRFFERSRNRSIQPLSLKLVEPVPSDIDIAVAQEPRNVKDICEELGLSGDEVSTAPPAKFRILLNCLFGCQTN
jgi:methylenetetrahydrofolate dehydrogenase (NADP+)/methenyltetrahydrofolate cyclohydrolase/formyltetrahydrofolate synthetase